jgi:type III secretion protein J
MTPRKRRSTTPPRPTTPTPPPSKPREELLLLLALLALAGCGRDEVVHGLDEAQANEVVVALDERGVSSEKRREEGTEERWAVAVAASAAPEAQRILAERELPRPRPPGFGEVFGKGSMVPTPTEERALYLHAVAGELARSVEAVDGVVTARVHLALPPADLLRTGPAPAPRAAVLVKTRPGARSRVEPLAPGIQALVAGAIAGLEPSSVSVVVAEGAAVVGLPRTRPWRPLLLAAAGATALSAAGLCAWACRGRIASLARLGTRRVAR